MEKLIIYLADDDHEDRQFFMDALDGIPLQTEVTHFDNGLDLMDKLFCDDTLPDIVFLDLYMPIMDGFECLMDIRNFKKFDEIQIVVYSTSFRQREVNQLKNDGANQYLKKSSSFKELKKLINKSLHKALSINSEKKEDREFIILT